MIYIYITLSSSKIYLCSILPLSSFIISISVCYLSLSECLYIHLSHIYIYIYIYGTGSLAKWVEGSQMVWETWLQSQVASYQRLSKWYLIPPCLTLSNLRYVSRVKWSNPGKGVVPFPTPRCSSYWKGTLQVTLDYSRQLLYIYIYIDIYIYILISLCLSIWVFYSIHFLSLSHT